MCIYIYIYVLVYTYIYICIYTLYMFWLCLNMAGVGPNMSQSRKSCDVLQIVAVCCSVLRYVAVCCVLQRVAACCRVLQGVAVCYSRHLDSNRESVVICVIVHVHVLKCAAVWCSVLQCVAVCWSVLQCVAGCCSVLQCVAAWYITRIVFTFYSKASFYSKMRQSCVKTLWCVRVWKRAVMCVMCVKRRSMYCVWERETVVICMGGSTL